ncbi:MurR/RpiR family transcriptional regulator [Pelagibius litoralis]|uniref:MurR/RpiR family transcriptional regulator n=1 Tax=Pelagibius litoralis TaxID=374515 RepID=A0A967EVV7_9PROT|nr:MurR/RpiR family transcriptional regulator [Pelagibius litoralis]NIA68479.1 MurR/RpiR family transcriptional regulator [Pelagibius litoralis]
MSIVVRMKDAAGRLTPSERKMVQEIVAKPRDAALGTAADLAQSIGVHEATASRLARKLGFDSYAGFRAALRDEFIARTDPAVRVRNTLEETRGADLIAELVAQETAALGALPEYLSIERIAQIADALHSARKIFIFARGNAETLAVMMERRLRRFGMSVVRLRGDGRDLAEQMVELTSADTVLAFAFRRQPRHYGAVVEYAQLRGAATIAIAGTVGPTLSPAVDHLLSAPRSGGREGFQSLIVPMTICNALVLQLARRDENRSLRVLESLGELIKRFDA